MEWSSLWNGVWWWWHGVRLMAYGAALAYAVVAYRRAVREVVRLNRQLADMNQRLDVQVEERTAALRASEERFALAVRGTSDGLWDWNVLTDEVYYAPRFKELLGCQDAELADTFASFEARLHPDDRERTLQAVRAHLERRERYDVEYRLRTKERGYRWFRARGEAVRDELGRPRRMAGAVTDITEEKRLRRRLETVFQASPTALLLADRGGRITLINSLGARLFGYEREELCGQVITVLVPGGRGSASPDRAPECLSSLTAGRSAEVSDRYGRRRDGSEFPIELGIRGVDTDDGPAVICGISDTTTQRQALETLQRAKEAADAANRAKSDFLANMSHEIRTPMCAVLGMTELVLDTELTTAQRECLGVVLESGESLLAIINEILDFSKIEAGKWELESTEFAVRETIGDALKSLALRANLKGLELAYLVESDVPERLLGDSGRLRQLIVNLVGNAIKFTERGEVVLRTWCESQTVDAVQLHVTVADTGVGIPADKQHVIFEAFTQADSSTTRRFGGTGLGLAIAQRVVALMNGRVWVDSEVGRGSTFHFTARFGWAQTDSVTGPGGSPPELHNLPVLVVDDNATNRHILRAMLGNCGLVPTTAASAQEALELLRSRDPSEDRFAFIVSDVNMPGMDGFELAAQIRGTAEFADTVILLLSSAERLGDSTRCAELGIAVSLTKPVSQAELREAITAALAGRRQVAEPALVKLEHTPPRAPTPLRVLVAEDGATNRRLLVGLLQKWGHTVTAVENGREALAALDRQPYDMVLMDVSMPEMDGLEATAAIRHQEQHTNRHLSIIALTAHALCGDRERCLAAGMDSYLTKPVRSSELLQAIETLWGQTAGRAPPPADSPCPNPPPAGPDAEPIDLNWEAAREAVGGGAVAWCAAV